MSVRPRLVLLGTVACAAALVVGVSFISLTALRLDREQAEARRQAAVEENVRLALWRMDSEVAPLVAREAALAEVAGAAGIVVEPAADDRVRLRFRLGADGRWQGAGPADAPGVVELAAKIDRSTLLAALARARAADPVRLVTGRPGGQAPAGATVAQEDCQPVEQCQRGDNEYLMRQRSVSEVSKKLSFSNANRAEPSALARVIAVPARVEAADVLAPLWLGGELLLARRVGADILAAPGGALVLGSWLDWPGLRAVLLAQVRDLVPGAALVPVPQAAAAADGNRMLASLPVRLVPSPPPSPADASPSPLRMLLGAAWGGVLLALGAVVLLLAGTLALGERRAAFVSAVTHELRTPLTTLRTYTEMLAEGMVTDEDKRRRYFATLKLEAERLAHLVENVLAYAGLERGRPAQRAEVIPVAELLARSSPRLEERARSAGLRLTIAARDGAVAGGDAAQAGEEGLCARADPGAVEQILFNLVDNACKYAAGGPGRQGRESGTVSITWRTAGDGRVALRVADDGPGIPRAARRRLFRPFSRSAESAAGSAPGVGLGLALCRGLARAMGGDLALEDSAVGTTFVLLLPRA